MGFFRKKRIKREKIKGINIFYSSLCTFYRCLNVDTTDFIGKTFKKYRKRRKSWEYLKRKKD